jgi:hypothetical protein
VAVVAAGLIHDAVEDRDPVFDVLHSSAQFIDIVGIQYEPPQVRRDS